MPEVRHEIRLSCGPTSPSRARSEVRRLLGHEHPVVDDAALAASELVTNAIRHSGCQTGDVIGFTLVVTDSFVRVEVRDPGASPTGPRLRSEPDAEDGRGLLIVQAIAAAWGVSRHDDRPGRTVWCALRITRPALDPS
ncbi:ATP-binding protein [Microbispora sp. NBC_01389]|uniref:ATP-binding protein n=1 Tax=Microbispora sp. NBC_01389 TaxID=2903584 RepID=UPI0032565A12